MVILCYLWRCQVTHYITQTFMYTNVHYLSQCHFYNEAYYLYIGTATMSGPGGLACRLACVSQYKLPSTTKKPFCFKFIEHEVHLKQAT
uniref:Uncharacterized protein n=1 Tax=Arion vulgaris TaxID=1028688 RepID=A0A0B7B374_9EUPU